VDFRGDADVETALIGFFDFSAGLCAQHAIIIYSFLKRFLEICDGISLERY
jgi:hypothetical protein